MIAEHFMKAMVGEDDCASLLNKNPVRAYLNKGSIEFFRIIERSFHGIFA